MNVQAAVFACRLTGFIGILVTLLLYKILEPQGVITGVIASSLWFLLGWHFNKKSIHKK